MLQKRSKFLSTNQLIQKLKYLFLLLMIGSGIKATPIIIKGYITNNSIPAAKGVSVRVQFTQQGDTSVVTDSLGQYEVTINPRLIQGMITASYIDACGRDSIFKTEPFDTSSNRTITINLNGCVPSGFLINGNVSNMPNPYFPLFIKYSLDQFRTQDSVLVDSNGVYSKSIIPNSNGQIEFQLKNCNLNYIKDSANFSIGDTVTKNFNFCGPPENSYYGTVTYNGLPVASNTAFVLRYEYNLTDQKMDFIDTLQLGPSGRFSFLRNSSSDYLIKAMPTDNSQPFTGTYYPSGAIWSAAKSFAIGPHLSDSNELIINLNSKQTSTTGRGIIAGELQIDDNLQIDGYSGVGIHLLNTNGTIVDFKYADASGNFKFENITSGDYLVWLDQCGIPTEPITVTISTNNESVDGLIITGNQLGISYDNFVSVNSTVSNFPDVSVFPNPFSNQLKIQSATKAEITVFNLFGQPIYNLNLLENETNRINTEHWLAGAYIVNVHSKTKDYSIKLLKD